MWLNHAVRPIITLMMTLAFLVIIVGAAFGLTVPEWQGVFTVLMGVFGPIVGFWFGEKSALKVPGQSPKPVDSP